MNELMLSNKNEILKLLGSVKRDGMDKLIKFLEESSYFIDPASSYYHSNFPGGLADHSLKVYKIFKQLCKMHKIDIPEESIIISALLHDTCKIGTYKVESQWLKNASTNNKWEEVYGYGFNEPTVVLPHGPLSVYKLMKFIDLTDLEAMCITYHMGAYTPDSTTWNEMRKANKINPAVLLLHHADMQSDAIYEPIYEKGKIPFIDEIK